MNYKKISPEEYNKIIDLHSNGESLASIASVYNVAPVSIRYILIKNKISTKRKFKISPEDHKKIIGLYNNGKNMTSIASIYNVTPASIRNILIKNGVPIKRKWGTKKNSPETVLNEKRMKKISGAEHPKIIKLYHDGDNLSKISCIYKVTPKSIRDILLKYKVKLRKKWKVKRKGRPSLPIEEQRIIVDSFIKSNKNISRAAELSKHSRPTVISVLKKNNILIPLQSKISPMYFPYIKEQYKTGESVKNLSIKYGVTIMTINKILKEEC